MVTNNSANLPRGTDGQIPISKTGAKAVPGNITSTGATVTVTNGPNTINLEVAGGGAGAWEYVSSTVISNDASVDITGLTSSYSYMLWLEGIYAITDAVILRLHEDTAGGASFGVWNGGHFIELHGTTLDGLSANTEDMTTGQLSDDSDETLSGHIIAYNPTVASQAHVAFELYGEESGSSPYMTHGHFYESSSAAVNALQLLTSNGNLAGGTVRLYRLAQS